jgi:hypothetical protein
MINVQDAIHMHEILIEKVGDLPTDLIDTIKENLMITLD